MERGLAWGETSGLEGLKTTVDPGPSVQIEAPGILGGHASTPPSCDWTGVLRRTDRTQLPYKSILQPQLVKRRGYGPDRTAERTVYPLSVPSIYAPPATESTYGWAIATFPRDQLCLQAILPLLSAVVDRSQRSSRLEEDGDTKQWGVCVGV